MERFVVDAFRRPGGAPQGAHYVPVTSKASERNVCATFAPEPLPAREASGSGANAQLEFVLYARWHNLGQPAFLTKQNLILRLKQQKTNGFLLFLAVYTAFQLLCCGPGLKLLSQSLQQGKNLGHGFEDILWSH